MISHFLPLFGEFELCDVSTFVINVPKLGSFLFVLVNEFVHKVNR